MRRNCIPGRCLGKLCRAAVLSAVDDFTENCRRTTAYTESSVWGEGAVRYEPGLSIWGHAQKDHLPMRAPK